MTQHAPRTVASLAVGEDGQVKLDPLLEAPVLEEAPAARSSVRSIYLNRPRALHALSHSMLLRIGARLRRHDEDPMVHCIVLRSTGDSGRAFCAGGDIRSLYEGAEQGVYTLCDQFFRTEYTLNDSISKLQTPLVSLWDGIVMGGGVGLSIHGRFRIATENTVFAMPECAIGLHPDIGASHFLPRLQGTAFGAYIALTGARVRGRDAYLVGLATHFVESHNIDALVHRLESVDIASYTAIDKVIREFAPAAAYEVYPSESARAVIERCFAADNVEDIIAELEKSASVNDDEEASFAKETLAMMAKGSPISLKVTLESVRQGANTKLENSLDKEFRLSVRCARNRNIVEGICAAVIDRSKPPTWSPSNVNQVTEEEVMNHFKPLDDLSVPELGLVSEQTETEARL